MQPTVAAGESPAQPVAPSAIPVVDTDEIEARRAVAKLLALPAAIPNEYDPFNPSVFEGAAAAVDYAAQRTEREEALAAQMLRMEQEQQRLSEQRQADLAAAAAAAAASGASAAGRGRGRGVSLLPAWATKSSQPAAPGGLAGNAAPSDGLTAAQRMMAKMGHVPGQGLGKHGTGITSALEHQKTGQNTGVIVQAGSSADDAAPSVRGAPSCVLLLRNLLAAGQWGDADKADILQECSKFAPALNCVVVELTGEEQRRAAVPAAAAVRVFVEFESATGAAAAGAALHGRTFGGRVVDASFFPEERYSGMQLMPQRGDA